MPLVCDTHTRARGRNVKCIRKLENTKTLGTNEQYYVYAMHCMRIDFWKIKKTFSNEMSEKKLRKRHSNRERKRSVYTVYSIYSSIFCAGGIYLFYLIFRRYIV